MKNDIDMDSVRYSVWVSVMDSVFNLLLVRSSYSAVMRHVKDSIIEIGNE